MHAPAYYDRYVLIAIAVMLLALAVPFAVMVWQR